tara:strand:+ start:73 stop:303 length:231 start_codon:yes stop_codon:yes gene_type:complete
MTKWEYMVVQIMGVNGQHGVLINGEKPSAAEMKRWSSDRYKMLNKVGGQGWELIKIRGVDTTRENGTEFFTFKRPL